MFILPKLNKYESFEFGLIIRVQWWNKFDQLLVTEPKDSNDLSFGKRTFNFTVALMFNITAYSR